MVRERPVERDTRSGRLPSRRLAGGAAGARVAFAMSAPAAGTGHRPAILVVEDDPDVRAMVARLLGTIGTVTAVANGVEALAVLRGGTTTDLVVTDVMMPLMDGVTLAKELKRDPQLSRIPVLMLTAKSSPMSMIEGINAGARQYLTKPFKPDDLLAKARKALAK